MIVASDWAGKTFAVLGLARSGAATVSALFAGGGGWWLGTRNRPSGRPSPRMTG